jgi:hypothetical protein
MRAARIAPPPDTRVRCQFNVLADIVERGRRLRGEGDRTDPDETT